MNRREFLKHSTAAVVATSTVLSACTKQQSKHPTTTIGEQEGTMTMRLNPNTGDEVSLLGFGMMRLPVIDGCSARENQNSQIDQDMVNEMVDYAISHGVNYFDTSPAYCQGHSEESTGIALARHPRDKYFIATKLSNFSPQTWSKEESQNMFRRSLQYLQTDYVDYLLLHGIGMAGGDKDGMGAFYARYMDNGILDWLVEQKKEGHIRNLGFSYHGDINVYDMLLKWHDEGKYHWDFVQIELNYIDWDYAHEINPRNTDARYLYAELAKRGISAVIMEPLLGGRLARQPEPIANRLRQHNPTASMAQWAFRFAGTPEDILTVLSGMTYIEHLKENVCTYSPLQPLTEEENTLLLSVAEDIYGLKAIPCTACNYCMPCPYGLNIPAIFAHYNKCISEDKMPHYGDTDQQHYMQQRRAFLIGYDRTVPKLRQADHCIGCNHCLSHCPQRIDIPHQMQMIDRFVERIKQN